MSMFSGKAPACPRTDEESCCRWQPSNMCTSASVNHCPEQIKVSQNDAIIAIIKVTLFVFEGICWHDWDGRCRYFQMFLGVCSSLTFTDRTRWSLAIRDVRGWWYPIDILFGWTRVNHTNCVSTYCQPSVWLLTYSLTFCFSLMGSRQPGWYSTTLCFNLISLDTFGDSKCWLSQGSPFEIAL